ncbi:MAG: DUF86 domain-containing protein [Candidatus Tectomicrobia bacterium]|nr:DUF86 domain-containing protein [Candidatus Tectomicrobia bacterium]
MSERTILVRKLEELDRYLAELERLRGHTFEDLATSLSLAWSVEHGLQLSIQIVLDIGNHILAALGEQEIENYVEVIEKLGERGIIPEDFSARIRGMAGFRNILVHEYAEVNLREVYRILQERLDDFREFARYIGNYIIEHMERE